MRITPRQYAEGLYEAVKRANPADRSDVIDRFLTLLARHRRRRDTMLVLRHVERIVEQETNVKCIDIVSAKPLSDASMVSLKSVGKNVFGGGEVLLRQKMNATLLGGALLRTENETFDASIGGRLDQLKKFLQRSV